MSDFRLTRRLVSVVGIRLDEAAFDQVRDGRATRGRRWSLRTLLVALTTAMVAGARSLADAERITDLLSSTARRWLGIPRRVPDTLAP